MPTTTTAKTTEATSALTDAIVSGVKQSQDLMLSGISAWVDFTGKAFSAPKIEGLPFMPLEVLLGGPVVRFQRRHVRPPLEMMPQLVRQCLPRFRAPIEVAEAGQGLE